MSRRNDKTEKGKRITIGKGAQEAIRPLVAEVNARMVGIRSALNVPGDWRVEHDQGGTPIAFMPPPEAPKPKAAKKKAKKKAKKRG